MSTTTNQLDPQWAWAPYEPDAKRPWSRRLVTHLYRRAGFGLCFDEIQSAVERGPAAAIAQLCNPPQPASEFESTSAMLASSAIYQGSAPHLAAWWLYRMLHTSDPLSEKLTLFWHGHFATSLTKVQSAGLMVEQNQMLRRLGRGKFAELVNAISRDPAMLIYLDSTSNRRIHPNENYARELMELFAMGGGNYTEDDIKQVARAFTGWELLGNRFHFDTIQHDIASKSFLGATGNFDGSDAIRIILSQPASPRFIARKLVRFFVFDEPAASDELIAPLATQLAENDFAIGPVVQRILSSNLFFSDSAIGRKIRSPVELGLGLLRSTGTTGNLVKLAEDLGQTGQSLFAPPSVKGWDGGRTWINSSTLLGRANLVTQMINASETHPVGGAKPLADVAATAGASGPRELVQFLTDLLMAVEMPSAASEALVQLAESKKSEPHGKLIASIISAMGVMPEFQLG